MHALADELCADPVVKVEEDQSASEGAGELQNVEEGAAQESEEGSPELQTGVEEIFFDTQDFPAPGPHKSSQHRMFQCFDPES